MRAARDDGAAQQILDAIWKLISPVFQVLGEGVNWLLGRIGILMTSSSAILVILGVFAFIALFSLLMGPRQSAICGTCGADTRRERHKAWCRRGRWGGSQEW